MIREICKEDTIDHDLISLPDLDTEEQESELIDQTTISHQVYLFSSCLLVL
jgi:hypothetical protein